jgi:hypothetical protein
MFTNRCTINWKYITYRKLPHKSITTQKHGVHINTSALLHSKGCVNGVQDEEINIHDFIQPKCHYCTTVNTDLCDAYVLTEM